MKSDWLKERRVGLEEAFFQKESQAALERLRNCHSMKEATGIDDGPLLTTLLNSGMTSESIAALFLTPLAPGARLFENGFKGALVLSSFWRWGLSLGQESLI